MVLGSKNLCGFTSFCIGLCTSFLVLPRPAYCVFLDMIWFLSQFRFMNEIGFLHERRNQSRSSAVGKSIQPTSMRIFAVPIINSDCLSAKAAKGSRVGWLKRLRTLNRTARTLFAKSTPQGLDVGFVILKNDAFARKAPRIGKGQLGKTRLANCSSSEIWWSRNPIFLSMLYLSPSGRWTL